MRPSILKAWYLSIGIFAAPARALAVWPPSTSLVMESDVGASSDAPPERMPLARRENLQAATLKLEQDERRLKGIIQDLKEDQAVLNDLSHPTAHHDQVGR